MICSCCKQDKPIELFNKDSHRPSGYRPHCKECKNAKQRDSKAIRRQRDREAALVHAAIEAERRKSMNIAAPRTYVSTETWVPEERAYYRNDGNRHIKSRGF